jgi:hypothetical protein
VPKKAIKKGRCTGKGVKTSAFKGIWKNNRSWLELRTDLLHTSSQLVGGGGEECGKKKSVAGKFAVKYKTETYYWTKN